MLTRRTMFALLSAALVGLYPSLTTAADTATPTTTISIQGMHCAGCAAKVTRHLQTIDGVATTQADAVQANAVVSPKPNAAPSPRSMWEAVEKSGYKPTRLVGPSGTFTEKPKS